MALETAFTVNQLDPANPSGPDRLAQGDDHIRLIKAVLKNTFPNINAPITVTDELINSIASLAVPVGVISLWYGSSASIPVGYALCDGNAAVPLSAGGGTIAVPDMRGRVAAGANVDHLTGTTFGQNTKTVATEVGGAHSHVGATTAGEGTHAHTVEIAGTALTTAQLPAHTHFAAKTGVNNGGISGSTAIAGEKNTDGDSDYRLTGGSGVADIGLTSPTGSGAVHAHTGTVGGSGVHAHTLAIDAVPAHFHELNIDVCQATIALHYIMKV